MKIPIPTVVGLCLLSSAVCAAETPRPNVVLILADDLGYGDLSCYGAADIATPNIDRLTREGTRFTSFYVGQPVCTASRAALMTGCYPNRVGMSGALNHTSPTGLNPRETLLSELFHKQGYATAAFGKWHLGHHPRFWPTHRGFDEFFGIPYSNDNGPLHPVTRGIPSLPLYDGNEVIELDPDQSQFTRRLTERAVSFIEKNQNRPFFLYVPEIMPHVPIAVSESFRGTSGRGLYGDVIQELDWSVGQIVSTIEKLNLDDRTLVIFASDNGPFLSYGEHAGSAAPLREGKLTTFEGGVRVPFIARWPGKIPQGRTTGELLTTMDLYVMLARLAGATLPNMKIDGKDFSPVLFGEPEAHGRDEFWYYSGKELHAVRQGKWKLHVPHEYLTVAGEPGRGGKPSEWGRLKPLSIEISGIRGIASRHGYRVENIGLSLFDLEQDPGETKNVAAEHPEIVERLMKQLAAARDDLGDELTGIAARNARPAGDVRPPVPPGVERISNLEFSRPKTGALLLDLYLPMKRSASAPLPVVLWIHGGGWIHGSKESCPLTWLAAKGYAVASINYRLLHEAIWPAQIEDCRAAIGWLRNHAKEYHLDGRRLAVAGGSAGAHLAALLGTIDVPEADRVSAVVDFYGPSDLLTMPSNTPGPGKSDTDLARTNGARLLGGIVRDRPELARQASALHQVSVGDAPFLILQGDQDQSVPLEQSQRLAARLEETGIPVSLKVLPGAGHGGKAFQTGEIQSVILGFLNEHVKGE
jgi:arylsulfatase